MAPILTDLSVITIVKNRKAHLDRLLAGVQANGTVPREIVVVDMSDEPLSLAQNDVPIITVRLDAGGLPLAQARNRGAEASSGQRLLFLDVDCIPRTGLLAMMDQALASQNALICAEVRYLGPHAPYQAGEAALLDASVVHPHRVFPEHGSRVEDNAGLFWSLLFGIRRETFVALGGFDERYDGYGAEDTDFGFRAKESGLPLVFISGTGAFHQYHGVIDPPLQHLQDIVRNANRFHRRWGVWPMDGWLDAFADRGLIRRDDRMVTLLRMPTPDEIDRARRPPDVYF